MWEITFKVSPKKDLDNTFESTSIEEVENYFKQITMEFFEVIELKKIKKMI